jgi:glycosyltransferase involved in cell wall biosynthesis
MRIGVDGRALAGAAGLRQARGIARYVSSLLEALTSRHPGDDWAVAPAGGRAARASAALVGRPRLDRSLGGGIDVVWLPAPAPVAVSHEVPYVLTVHDLSAELRPGDFGPYARLWNRAARPGRLARRAARVIADSDETRDQAVERWALGPERISVVRPGFWRPPPPRDGALARLNLPARYLLYVGALEPRKGVDVLAAAFADARGRGLEAELVLAGDGPLAESLRGPGVALPGRVSDSELAALYAGARATVLPSWLEGFGFTPLESLAAGTPAVVSDLASLRETLGDAALTVPPGDPRALADALLRVDRDDALRARLLDAAGPRLERLSWETAADEVHAVLVEAAGG